MCVRAHVCVFVCVYVLEVRSHNTMTQLNVACHHIAHSRLSGLLLESLSSGEQ